MQWALMIRQSPVNRMRYVTLLLLPLLYGCQESSSPAEKLPPQRETDRAPVLAALEAAKSDALTDAFATVSAYAHTQRSRTETRVDNQIAAVGQTVRMHGLDDRPPSILARDTLGAVDADRTETLLLRDLTHIPSHVLPDDPPYLSARFHENYRYQLLRDTLFWERPTKVIDIRASDASQSITHARYFVDRPTSNIVAVSIERTENTLFFAEVSHFYVSLRPGPEQKWVPHHIRFVSRLRLPLHPVRTIRTATTFYDYPASSGRGPLW